MPTARHPADSQPQAFYRCGGCGALITGGRYCDDYCEQRYAARGATREPIALYRLRLLIFNWSTPLAGVVLLAALLLTALVLP